MFGKCKCLSTAKISSLQICIKDKKKKKDIFDGSWMKLHSTLVKWSYDISMTWNRYWAIYIICLIVAFSPHMNCLETIVCFWSSWSFCALGSSGSVTSLFWDALYWFPPLNQVSRRWLAPILFHSAFVSFRFQLLFGTAHIPFISQII